MFVVVSGFGWVGAILDWHLIGSHALIYTDAARAWLSGGDPWAVGPPQVRFAGPPPMLLPLVPFVFLPSEVTRWVWVIGDFLVTTVVLRTLQLPAWWVAFPPVFSAIMLGHPEILVLGLVLLTSPIAGLAVVIKPYAALPLLAERNWKALLVALGLIVVTAPILPWSRFAAELPSITVVLVRQSVGDSVFGQPLLVAVALATVFVLGIRRFLWLGTPVVWPATQPYYKAVSIPMISPLLALFWAIPVQGMTLAGMVTFAVALALNRRRPLPGWLRRGLDSPLLEAGASVGILSGSSPRSETAPTASPAARPGSTMDIRALARRIVGKVS